MFKFKTKAQQRKVAMELKLNSSTTADGLMSSHTCSNTIVVRSINRYVTRNKNEF
jgi:hypothetical protein